MLRVRLPFMLVAALAVALAACGPAADRGGDGDGGGDDDIDAGGGGPVICAADTTEDCYNGTPGTAGTGPCKAGTRTCSPDGTQWSVCQGEVVNSAQDACSNGVDDDCDGTVDNALDLDGDGYTRCTGDCCEQTTECGDPVKVGPGAAEAPTLMGEIPVDDDCDGQIDEVELPCDGAFAIDDPDPLHGAQALGLCRPVDIVSAGYVRANGAGAASTAQNGLLADFGPNVMVREGARMVGLSSGYARDATDPGNCGTLSCYGSGASTAPPGFPQDVPSCAGSTAINDDAALEVHLKAPTNATGFSIDFAFYSFEYPEWVCTSFNDQFIVLVDPPPPGSINGNIAFDSMTNPVSVNVAFFDVCSGCPGGTAALQGTGFDTWNDAGATVWLRSTAPITGGQEFTLRLAIWDTGDQAWDSTVLVDNFQWILSGSPGVNTNPIP